MVGVVVIAIVVVGALFATALVARTSTSSTSIEGTPLSYDTFYPPAVSALGSAEDGPWTPIAVLAIGTSESISGTAGASGVGAGGSCSSVWSYSGPVTFPATPIGAPVGEVSAWFLVSRDSANDLLITLVANTTGAVLATNLEIGPQSCLTGAAGYGTLTGTYVNSINAAAAVNSVGGSAFLASNPGATVELGIFNMSGLTLWAVIYSTCQYTATGGTGNEFLGAVGATNGTLVDHESESDVPCS